MGSNQNNNRSASVALAAAALGIALTGAAAVKAERNAPDGDAAGPPSMARLQRLVPGAAVGEPRPTVVDGVFQARVGDGYVYVTSDGQHAFTGDLLDLDTGQNLTEVDRNGDRLAALDGFPDNALLVLTASGGRRPVSTSLPTPVALTARNCTGGPGATRGRRNRGLHPVPARRTARSRLPGAALGLVCR
jgi:hypothetical protein